MFRYLGRAAGFFRLFVIKEEEEEETRLLYFSLSLIIIPLFFFFSPDDDNCAERFSFSFASFVALAISSKIATKIYIYFLQPLASNSQDRMT